MKKRLLSIVLVFALVFGAIAIVPTTTQAKKHSPKYYQNKLKRYLKRHGKKEDGEYVYKYTYEDLDVSIAYDPVIDEFDFTCFMLMYDEYNEDDDTDIYVSLSFERGNNKEANVYASIDMLEGNNEYEIRGSSKYQKLKKFTVKKIKFGKIKSYIGQKKGKKILKKLIKPCFPVWKELLKMMGFSFKKLGFKKLK